MHKLYASSTKWLSLTFFLCLQLKGLCQTFSYPPSPRQPVTDTLFGKLIVDDYRWMEDVSNPKTKDWLNKQAVFTENIINQIPGRDELLAEFKQLDALKKEEISSVTRKRGRYFYRKTLPGENVGKLFYRQGKTGGEVLLFDPTTYKGPSGQITYGFIPSDDGNKVAINITQAGKADICLVKILDVQTRSFAADSLYPVLGEIDSWAPDSKGFSYKEAQTSDPSSVLLFQDIRIKYHQLGSPTSKDKILISRQNNPELGLDNKSYPWLGFSPFHDYLMAYFWHTDYVQIFFAPLSELGKTKVSWKPLLRKEDLGTDAIIHHDSAYILTRKKASTYKVIVKPLSDLETLGRVLLPESANVIQWISTAKDYLFITKSDGVNFSIVQYNYKNRQLENVKLPSGGTAWLQPFDTQSNDCLLSMNSWIRPQTIYDYEPARQTSRMSSFNRSPNYPGLGDLVAEEVEAKSHDGTMVPLSIIYNKEVRKDGNNIAYLVGYGSYASSMPPYFEMTRLPLLNRGVVLAIAHVRGGGEKGYAWHMGGYKATKPNTWKDFIACAEYLVQNGFTSPMQIIGEGMSAGGILIGRAMTERPDLFAVAINNVPVSNPLRGEFRPNGELDSKEFGTLKDSAETSGLLEMDTYLHIESNKQYPAVLAVTGINDTRVPFWQPGKLVAKMQTEALQQKPVLLLVNYDSGHWSDEKAVQFRNYANIYAFALWQAGHKAFQLRNTNPQAGQ